MLKHLIKFLIMYRFLTGDVIYFLMSLCVMIRQKGGRQMQCTQQLTDEIQRIFHKSPMAAAVVGEGGTVIYRNPACESLCPDIDFSCVKTGASCEMYASCGSRTFMLSIAPVSDSVSLVNITPAALDETVFKGIAATIRDTALEVTEVLNSLSREINDIRLLEELDKIDSHMLAVFSEVLVPETISRMKSEGRSSLPISISEELLSFGEDLSYMLASENINIGDFDRIKAGLTARMNKDALRLLMLEFISEYLDGEYMVHGISLMLNRTGKDKILLELSCGYFGNLPKKVEEARVNRKGDYAPARMLREEMERIYGCHISCRNNDMVSTLSVEMRFEEAESGETLGNRMSHYVAPNRYTDVSLYCARYGMNHRYRNEKY